MAVLLERLEKEGSVPLEYYGHQVGGHHALFQFRDALVKPVVLREHFFYRTAPEILKKYLPSYSGVVDVSYKSDSSGNIVTLASPKPQPLLTPPPPYQLCNELSCSSGETIHEDERMLTVSRHTGSGADFKNPWSQLCSQIMKRKLKEMEYLDKVTEEYMVLENLSSKFHSPSVLDVKMGTRQHGDDACPEKVIKHKHTCANSTSGSLGIRLAGMQLFNKSRKEYTFRDKYYGRQLTEETLSQVLCSFLSNGEMFRSDLLPSLTSMLEDLRRVISALPSYRYYSSSLVIIYDGAESSGCTLNPENMTRLLNEIVKYDTPILVDSALDSGGGANNGANNHVSSLLNHTPSCTTSSEDLPNHTPPHSVDSPSDYTPSSHTDHTSSPCAMMSSAELALARNVVDVRMIDFAHSTHTGYHQDPIKHEGIDESFLEGLDSLIRIFKNISTALVKVGCGSSENGCGV